MWACWCPNVFFCFLFAAMLFVLPSTAHAKKKWMDLFWLALGMDSFGNQFWTFFKAPVLDNTLLLNTFCMKLICHYHCFFPRKGSWTRCLQTIQDNIQMKRRLRCARTIEHTISQNYWHFLLAKNMCLNELQYMWTFLDGSNLFCLWHWYVFSLSCYCQGT